MSAKFPRGGEQGLFWPAVYLKMPCRYHNHMSQPDRRGVGHIVFGADPVGVGFGVTLSCLQYLINWWVDFN